jgi:hypothetical protein
VIYTQEKNEVETEWDVTEVPDLSLLDSARSIYSNYREIHVESQPPVGVAINRDTLRGHLIFTGKPILLHNECFVPFSQLQQPEPIAS